MAFRRRFKRYARFTLRKAVPILSSIFLILLELLPFGSYGSHTIVPLFLALSVFYWSVYYPKLMPYWAIFCLGLLSDALNIMPLGFSSLLYMLLRVVVMSQRGVLLRQMFWGVWCGCSILLLGVVIARFGVLEFFYGTAPPVSGFVVQWLFSTALYPLLHAVFHRMYSSIKK